MACCSVRPSSTINGLFRYVPHCFRNGAASDAAALCDCIAQPTADQSGEMMVGAHAALAADNDPVRCAAFNVQLAEGPDARARNSRTGFAAGTLRRMMMLAACRRLASSVVVPSHTFGYPSPQSAGSISADVLRSLGQELPVQLVALTNELEQSLHATRGRPDCRTRRLAMHRTRAAAVRAAA